MKKLYKHKNKILFAVLISLLIPSLVFSPISVSAVTYYGLQIRGGGGNVGFSSFDTLSSNEFTPFLNPVFLQTPITLTLPSQWPYSLDTTIVLNTADGYLYLHYDLNKYIAFIGNRYMLYDDNVRIQSYFCVGHYEDSVLGYGTLEVHEHLYLDGEEDGIQYMYAGSSSVRLDGADRMFLLTSAREEDGDYNYYNSSSSILWMPAYYQSLYIPFPLTTDPYVGHGEDWYANIYPAGSRTDSNNTTYFYRSTELDKYYIYNVSGGSGGFTNSVPIVTSTPTPTDVIPPDYPYPTQKPYYTQVPQYTQIPYPTQKPYYTQAPQYTQIPYPTQVPYYTQIPYPTQGPGIWDILQTQIPLPTFEPFAPDDGNIGNQINGFVGSLNSVSNSFQNSFKFVRDSIQLIYEELGQYAIVLYVGLGIAIITILLRFLR